MNTRSEKTLTDELKLVIHEGLDLEVLRLKVTSGTGWTQTKLKQEGIGS
jgi:hypothetical protein